MDQKLCVIKEILDKRLQIRHGSLLWRYGPSEVGVKIPQHLRLSAFPKENPLTILEVSNTEPSEVQVITS